MIRSTSGDLPALADGGEGALTPDGIASILSRYGLAGPFGAARRLAHGPTSAVWLLPGPPALVLRRYVAEAATLGGIAFHHEVMAYLGGRSALVAPPLLDRYGATVVEHGAGRWALFPFIDGAAGNCGPAAGKEAAAELARHHRWLSTLRPAGKPLRVSSVRVLGECRELAEGLQADRGADPIDWHRFATICRAAERRLAAEEQMLPRQIVHGDFLRCNTVFRDEQIVGIIDFERAHETERVYDLAAAVESFARISGARLDLTAAGDIVEAYGAVAALSEAERRCIGAMLIRILALKTIEVQIDFEQRAHKSEIYLRRMIDAYDAWLI